MENKTPTHLKRKREEFEKDTIELLTCPICFEYLSDPTYQCIRGHVICVTCFKNVICTTKWCPQCRCKYDPDFLQNKFLEQMLTLFQYVCSFSNYGCKAKLNLAERLKHEEICPFNKEVNCPIHIPNDFLNIHFSVICPWKGKIDDLVGHLKTVHLKKEEPFTSNKVCLNYPETFSFFEIGLPYFIDRLLKLPCGYVYIAMNIAENITLYVRPLTLNDKMQTVHLEFRNPDKPDGCYKISRPSRSMRYAKFQECLFTLFMFDIMEFCGLDFKFWLSIEETN